MAGASLNPPDASYLAAVNRVEERLRLQAQAQKRRSMLIFGPEGVGKTRLLQVFVKAEPLALYVPHIRSPRELMLSLVQDLRRLEDREIRLPDDQKPLSTPSLKGIVQRALATRPFLLVLDHIAGPSRPVAGAIRHFTDYGKRPILFAARSPHMEDIGALQPLCADRSERLELKPFPAAVALEFARREAERTGLWASNLEAVLHSLVEWSNGNPGAILQMLKMADTPRYRMGDQIKAHVLYLDFRMGRQQLR
jgi:predicted AAA+ superfamily ATPase